MASDLSRIWANSKAILSDTLPKNIYDRWVSVMEFSHLDGGTLYLQVPSGLYLDWVKDNYLPLITQAVRSVDEGVSGIELTINKSIAIVNSSRSSNDNARVSDPQRGSTSKKNETLISEYSFDDFVVGDSNSFAHAAALAVAQAPAKAYNPLFIYGGVGLGKTHLMHAIGNYVFKRKRKSVCYISSESFLNEYISALQNRKLPQFRSKYRGIDLLLIDDIHFLAGKERMQEEFFHTFNSLHNNKKQIVLTSDKSPGELSGLEARLVSRFEWGMVTQLEQPDFETRMAILRNKAHENSVSMKEDILTYLADNISSNVRRLEGALIRVSSYMSLHKTDELSREQIDTLLSDLFEQEKKPPLSIEMIQQRVAECYNIQRSDILGTCRLKSIALPRQIAMYLSRELTEHSFPAIGEAFNRNHATILHACRKVETHLNSNQDLRNTMISIKKGIQ